jgi:hypothetical protein
MSDSMVGKGRTRGNWAGVAALVGAAALAAGGTACVKKSVDRPDAAFATEMAPDFAQKVPLNVAVLPPVNVTGKEMPIARQFREYAKDALVDRWYSPIAFSVVDSRVGPRERFTPYDLDRLRGTFEEDAILTAQLAQWDSTYLRNQHKVLAGGEFALYDSKSGSKLWGATFSDYWVPIEAGPGTIATEDFYEYEHRAMREFVRRCFAEFPKRISKTQS